MPNVPQPKALVPDPNAIPEPDENVMKKDMPQAKLHGIIPGFTIAHFRFRNAEGVVVEEAALKDPYFVERKLYPNVDFYSGIIMRALGIPVEMFTVIFAIGRMPGWIANYKEVMEDSETRIYRPRQIYMGPTLHSYVPIKDRK